MEVLNKDIEKISIINQFMKELLSDESLISKREIYDKYKEIVNQVQPIDFFYLDMYKEDSEFTIEEIKESAGKFINVFHSALSNYEPSGYDSTLFSYFLKENRAIERELDKLKPYFKQSNIVGNVKEIIKGFEKLFELEKKFIKKENILWPSIEEKLPSIMPLKVLWSMHDDSRVVLKNILIALKKEILDVTNVVFLIGEYYYLIYGLNQKEELILLPVADTLLSLEEKDKMYEESLEFGYCFIDELPKPKEDKTEKKIEEGIFKTKTGSLSMKEIDSLFSYIPLDITFVDVNNKVKYFNNRPERHFPRNPSIVGRLVKYCHPPKSVEVVERIVDAFKNGEEDFAEFWIDFRGTFLYITYYAVRDNAKNYMGILEVSQDVTKIRGLNGQQRLLDWK